MKIEQELTLFIVNELVKTLDLDEAASTRIRLYARGFAERFPQKCDTFVTSVAEKMVELAEREKAK